MHIKKYLLRYYMMACVLSGGFVLAQDSVKIMPLGDSITELNWQGGYRSYLYKLLSDSGFTFDYVGRQTKNHDDNSVGFDFPTPYWNHEGYTGRAIFPTWLDHIDTALIANPPDIILLMLGTNDVANGSRSALQIRNHMSAFLDSIWKFDPNIKVVLSNLPRIVPGTLFSQKKLDSTINTNALWPGLVEEKKQAGRYIILIDNFSALAETTDFDGDGIHPSVAGYKKMRYVWYPAVVSALLSVSKAEFKVEPTNTVGGISFNPTVEVQIKNILGNVVTGDNTTSLTLSIKSNPGNGVLTGGGPVTVTNGIASFPGLSINKAGIGYTLEASSPTVIFNAISDSFTVSPGAAAQLSFDVEPTNSTSGVFINPPVSVRITDLHQNTVTADNTTSVTLSLASHPGGGILTGGGPVMAVNGIATFTDLKVDKPGSGYRLIATSTPAFTVDTSASFNIATGAAAKLAFEVEPSTVQSGDTIKPAVIVRIEDGNANVVTLDNTTSVTISLHSNPGGGTLTGGGPVTAVNGIATFAALSIDKPGTGYALSVTSNPVLLTAISDTFNILPATSVVDVSSGVPAVFSLGQNYPNPFNPTTTIRYSIPAENFVTLNVYDLLGRLMQNLVAEVQVAGAYSASFDASIIPSGVYFYTIHAGSFTAVKKMVLMK